MILIGVCGGSAADRIAVSDFVKRYKAETGLYVQVLLFDNGDDLLCRYPFEMDLIFIDITPAKMNGIEIARKIRESDTRVGIVFLAGALNHVLDAYEVRADNYFVKPLKYSRFLQEIEKSREKRGRNSFFIETNDNGIYKIYINSIYYIETEDRKTKIHTETDTITSYKRMKEHEQALSEPYFIRCHTGFIINLLHFEKLEQNDIILFSGVRVPLSRNRKKEVVNRINSLYSEKI